jgi:hypothetical protein
MARLIRSRRGVASRLLDLLPVPWPPGREDGVSIEAVKVTYRRRHGNDYSKVGGSRYTKQWVGAYIKFCRMLPSMRGTWRREMGRPAPILAIGLVGILVAAPSASGQAALDQYVPQGNPAGGPKGAGSLANPITAQNPSGRSDLKVKSDPGSGTEKGGRLPVADYPSTPFLWIVIAILGAAVLIRVAVSVRKRTGALGSS